MAAVKVTKAEMYLAPDGWRFRLKAGNGEIVATGEAYRHYVDAEAAVRALAPSVRIVEVES